MTATGSAAADWQNPTGGVSQLTGDVTAGPGTGSLAATLVGTSNVESIIRAQDFNQLQAPTAAMSANGQRWTTLALPLLTTAAATAANAILGQTYYAPPGGSAYTVNSSTFAAIDSTNLTVSFTAISTEVWVELDCVVGYFSNSTANGPHLLPVHPRHHHPGRVSHDGLDLSRYGQHLHDHQDAGAWPDHRHQLPARLGLGHDDQLEPDRPAQRQGGQQRRSRDGRSASGDEGVLDLMVDTHCLPTGALGTGEIPVCNVGRASVSINRPGGLVRGVVVSMHGLSVSPAVTPQPLPTANITIPAFNDYSFQLMNSLTADHWIYMPVNMPEDFWSLQGGGSRAIFEDINLDAGNGRRVLAATLNGWDHNVDYININIAAGIPIIALGGSGGGWHTIKIASNRQTTLGGYACYIPACIFPNISPLFLPGIPFNTIDCDGMEISTHDLDAVTIPGLISYGTNDEVVGWAAQNVASGSSGVSVSKLHRLRQSPHHHHHRHYQRAERHGHRACRRDRPGSHQLHRHHHGHSRHADRLQDHVRLGHADHGTAVHPKQHQRPHLLGRLQRPARDPIGHVRLPRADEAPTATSISNWFASTLDPLFPAAF